MPAYSAYIHIPFCLSKCKYCSFVSFTDRQESCHIYHYHLLKEIDYYYRGEPLNTIYFGGGTPSLMAIENLQKILNKFDIDSNAEITIEVNPDSVDKEYLTGLKEIGFNRLSIGSQTFNDDLLKQIGRRHDSKQIFQTIEWAKEVGFDNISVDLIYGLPGQTPEMFKYDLETILTIPITHVSLYGLKIEEGCYFYTHKPDNIPDDDIQADMYLMSAEILKEFKHYEISNYSKPKFESRHNLNYWQGNEYYGFGVAAHGYVDGVRYSNYCTLQEYMDNPTSHEFGKFLTEKEKQEEKIFLGFRIADGIVVDDGFEAKYKDVLKKYTKSGHILKTDKGYKLSNEGFLLSNIILSEFID